MNLPFDLEAALESELSGIPAKSLAGAAGMLSQQYRERHARAEQPQIDSTLDVAAYLAHRLPATYAAIFAALAEVRARMPHWQPRTLLDCGAGPGTAIWAATRIWPQIEQVMLLEKDAGMIALGRKLAAHADAQAVRQATWRKVDLAGPWQGGSSDLAIAAYLLGEIPTAGQAALVARLWEGTAGVLLLVEPGTPRGFEIIRQAREHLRAAGAYIVAPCPHGLDCPMPADDWCHFAQRITRTRFQRSVKQASLGYEDEKFSYIAVSRLPGTAISARVLRHPQVRPGRIELELCTDEGIQHRTVTHSNKAAFRQARESAWGTAFEEKSVSD